MLCDLYLRDFRNYKEAFFEFSTEINKIYGANAQGKTNLLEAINLLITGQSFRTHNLSELIREGAPSFYVEANFVKNDIKQKLRIYYDGQRRRVFHNSTEYNSFTPLIMLIPGVIWSPEDQALVKGSPSMRRRFLDFQIAQLDPLYVHHLMRYNKAMKQRNYLLRSKNDKSIDSWEFAMAHAAAYVVEKRRSEIKKLLPQIQNVHETLSKTKDTLSVEYKTGAPNISLSEYYVGQYKKQRQREMIIGNTLSGPHRDDVIMSIQKKDARYFASQGQQRCCIAAMRLAQWYQLQQESDTTPLMIIDDVGTSLDESRNKLLGEQIQKLGQVFVSTSQDLNWQNYRKSKIMIIKNGQVFS